MNHPSQPNDVASGSLGKGDVPESSRILPADPPERATQAVVATGQFVAWLAIGFAVTLVGALIGLVLYVLFGLEGDERTWGGAVFMIGVFYCLLGAAGWAIIPPIAAIVDRKLAIGTVLLGFVAGVLSFFVIW